jgi:hypothetical protein
MRRLAVAVIVVVLLGAAALYLDRAVATTAERRAGERVSEVIDAPAEVRLHGWAVGLRILVGRVPRAEVRATDVPMDDGSGAAIDTLDVTLEDVRLRWSDLNGEADDWPPARAGTFEATLSADTVWSVSRVPRVLLDMRISDGAVRLRLAGFEAAAEVRARDGNVDIVPRSPVARLLGAGMSIDVTGRTGSPYVEEVEVVDDALVVRGRLQEVETAARG